MVLQDVSRRTLSTGFAREEDDTRGAEHRNETTAILSSFRTMPNGVVTAFLASSSIHGDLLEHVVRAPTQSDNSFGMIRADGSQHARLLLRNRRLALQSEFSNDRVENSAAFKMAAEATRYRIKAYRAGALRYVSWFTSTQNALLPVCRSAFGGLVPASD